MLKTYNNDHCGGGRWLWYIYTFIAVGRETVPLLTLRMEGVNKEVSLLAPLRVLLAASAAAFVRL